MVKPFGMNSRHATLMLKIEELALEQHADYDHLALHTLWRTLLRQAQLVEIITRNFCHSAVHLLDDKTQTMSQHISACTRVS